MSETKCSIEPNSIVGDSLKTTLSNVIEVLLIVDSVIEPQDRQLIDEALYGHASCLVMRCAGDALIYARDHQTLSA